MTGFLDRLAAYLHGEVPGVTVRPRGPFEPEPGSGPGLWPATDLAGPDDEVGHGPGPGPDSAPPPPGPAAPGPVDPGLAGLGPDSSRAADAGVPGPEVAHPGNAGDPAPASSRPDTGPRSAGRAGRRPPDGPAQPARLAPRPDRLPPPGEGPSGSWPGDDLPAGSLSGRDTGPPDAGPAGAGPPGTTAVSRSPAAGGAAGVNRGPEEGARWPASGADGVEGVAAPAVIPESSSGSEAPAAGPGREPARAAPPSLDELLARHVVPALRAAGAVRPGRDTVRLTDEPVTGHRGGDVHVHLGRIEVVQPPPAAQGAPARPRPRRPAPDHEAYLAARRQQGRR